MNWTATPFLVWLYARMTAHNQSSSMATAMQIVLLEEAIKTIPYPKNRIQRIVHAIVLRKLERMLENLNIVFEAGLFMSGWISFDEKKS